MKLLGDLGSVGLRGALPPPKKNKFRLSICLNDLQGLGCFHVVKFYISLRIYLEPFLYTSVT